MITKKLVFQLNTRKGEDEPDDYELVKMINVMPGFWTWNKLFPKNIKEGKTVEFYLGATYDESEIESAADYLEIELYKA